MSDPRVAFGADFARGAKDPIVNLIAATTDAWTIGLSSLQFMAEQARAAIMGTGPPTDDGGDPLSALTALTTGFTAAMSDFIVRGAGPMAGLRSVMRDAPAPGVSANRADFSSQIPRALLVGMTSTLRYWRGLADVYGRHHGSLMEAAARRTMAASPIAETEDRMLVDELRAFFREIGEVAAQEAARLESELEQVGEALADGAVQQPDFSAEYRRRWKAKD
jgi:hypothetical protein